MDSELEQPLIHIGRDPRRQVPDLRYSLQTGKEIFSKTIVFRNAKGGDGVDFHRFNPESLSTRMKFPNRVFRIKGLRGWKESAVEIRFGWPQVHHPPFHIDLHGRQNDYIVWQIYCFVKIVLSDTKLLENALGKTLNEHLSIDTIRLCSLKHVSENIWQPFFKMQLPMSTVMAMASFWIDDSLHCATPFDRRVSPSEHMDVDVETTAVHPDPVPEPDVSSFASPLDHSRIPSVSARSPHSSHPITIPSTQIRAHTPRVVTIPTGLDPLIHSPSALSSQTAIPQEGPCGFSSATRTDQPSDLAQGASPDSYSQPITSALIQPDIHSVTSGTSPSSASHARTHSSGSSGSSTAIPPFVDPLSGGLADPNWFSQFGNIVAPLTINVQSDDQHQTWKVNTDPSFVKVLFPLWVHPTLAAQNDSMLCSPLDEEIGGALMKEYYGMTCTSSSSVADNFQFFTWDDIYKPR
ncbi:hypothetical protein SISNIDRAFT_471087 [Sistotremastrum niveocremeum HHB9708]|uniref:Uncharacterized protein n=1 Tax=Sistotremastrum niveocremeum HHB9708 TaxID=1314777 RepID=A0A164N460_9AGAM|nr:hypothetical protein SISNIDRAFT_471087 [Sistotremastrum niveocremeum HHB9708]